MTRQRRLVGVTSSEARSWWVHGALLVPQGEEGREVVWFRSTHESSVRDYSSVVAVLQRPPTTVESANQRQIIRAGGMIVGVNFIPTGGFGMKPANEPESKVVRVRGHHAFLHEMYQEHEMPSQESRKTWQTRSNVTGRDIWWRDTRTDGSVLLWTVLTDPVLMSETEAVSAIDSMSVLH